MCQLPTSFLYMHKDLEKDNVHSLVLVQRKSCILSVKIVHKESGTIWRKGSCWNSQKADIQSYVPRVHCPEFSSNAKAVENCRYTLVPIWKRFKTVFRTIISANQLSLYGAVANMCEEYQSFRDRTGKPVVEGQSSSSFVPSVIKTNVLLDNDDRARKDLLLKRYGERIEKLSQQDK